MFSFGQQGTTTPSATFGGFSTANASKPNPTFGTSFTNQSPSFNLQGSNAPPSSGFGGFTTSATSTQAPNPFGQSASVPSPFKTATNSGFGFGSQPALSSFNIPSSGQSISAGAGFGSTLGGWGTNTAAQVPQTTDASFPLGADTPYKSLPPHIQAAFVDVYNNYKKPVKMGLATLSRVTDRKIDQITELIHTTNLATIQLSKQHEILLENVMQMRDDVKETCSKSFEVCEVGVQEIKKRGNSLKMTSTIGDVSLLEKILAQLREKLLVCGTRIDQLGFKYAASQAISGQRGQGAYAQHMAIGPQQLLQLIQKQNESLFKVAAEMAEIHRDADELRRKYLLILPTRATNPFDEAETKEMSDKKRLLQKLRSEVQESIRSKIPALGTTPLQPSQSFGFSGLGSTASSGFGASGFSMGQSNQSLGTTAKPSMGSLGLGQSSPAPTSAGTLNALDLAKPSSFAGMTAPPPVMSPSVKKNQRIRKNV